jgi:poly(3-hydroxyalkanoate) depolymerase
MFSMLETNINAAQPRSGLRSPKLRSAGMNARIVRVLDQDLWVVTKPGRKDRPPLLLFNGIGANAELAEPLMRAMGDIEAVIFDVPGVGGSPLPKLPYRASTVARWAAELTRQLGYEKVDVAGVSWGGAIAQEFAHRNRAICRRLILAATSPGALMVPGKLSVLSKMASPRRYMDPGYLRSIAAEVYGGNFRLDPSFVNAHAENMKGASNLGYLYQLLAVVGWTSVFWLHTLKQPALVVMGNDDPIVPLVNGRILARMIPDARLEIMNCGHLFAVTMPHETAAIFRHFLGED